jgi:hypothetical protein
VETVPEGWWYIANLPDGKAVAALMTDADPLRGLGISITTDFLAALSVTRHVAARLDGAVPVSEPRAFPAESHVLNPPCGPGWIAAGDAACAFDPLASLGIGYALTSGIQAARIVEQWLRGEDGLARISHTRFRRLRCGLWLHCRIVLMLRMVFDLPDFECTFPAPFMSSVVGAYVVLRCLVCAAQAPARRSRACARANSCWYGQAEAIATWIRRTLIFTSAPILSSFSRMLPQLARANWVKASPMRRSAQSST